MSRTWYEFKASSTADETEVLLYDEIGGFGVSAARFVEDLRQVPSAHRLVLRIHSPGGSVLDGNAIFNALKGHAGGVRTHIDGLAASMASVVALAGEPVQMAGNGILMIHNVTAWAEGDAEEMRRVADLAEKVQETVVAVYSAKTGMGKKRIREMMDAETWMSAKEALAHGFIDEITGDRSLAAHFDLSRFRNAATHLTRAGEVMATTATLPTPEESLTLLQRLAAFFRNAEAEQSRLEATRVTDQLAAITSERDKLLAQVATLQADVAAATKAAADTAATVSDKVIEHLAAAGAEPLALDASAASGGGNILEQFISITDPTEKTRFYRSNRAAISAAYSAQRRK